MRRVYKRLLAVYLLMLPLLPAPLMAEAAPPVNAAEKTVQFIGKYNFSWGGIRLGELALSIDEKEDAYAVRLAVISAGIVNLFTRHENNTTAEGAKLNGRYLPKHYESHYKTKKKPRHIRLAYNRAGDVTEELNEPPENRALRPEVPAEKKKGSYDPLTLLLAMRNDVTPLIAFDAKRLYELNMKKQDVETLSIMGKEVPATHYILSRTPIAGLTDKEKKEYEKGEPPIHFYVSTDEQRVPVYMTMPVFMGSVKGVLTQTCKTWDECKVQ